VRIGTGENFPGALLAGHFLPADSGHQLEPFLDVFHVLGSLFFGDMGEVSSGFSTMKAAYHLTG